jgi:hypothetical protein
MTAQKKLTREEQIALLKKAVSAVRALDMNDPKNQMTDEEFAKVSEDVTGKEEGKITTIARK